MSFWKREPNGDNPHWLCLTITALPVLTALGLAWWSRPSAANQTPEPSSISVTEAVPTTDHDLKLASRGP